MGGGNFCFDDYIYRMPQSLTLNVKGSSLSRFRARYLVKSFQEVDISVLRKGRHDVLQDSLKGRNSVIALFRESWAVWNEGAPGSHANEW